MTDNVVMATFFSIQNVGRTLYYRKENRKYISLSTMYRNYNSVRAI